MLSQPPDPRQAPPADVVNGAKLTVAATPTLDDLKALAAGNGCRVPDMLALSPFVDPFNVDQPSKRERGEWFARLWRESGFPAGTHLRRVHYVLVSGQNPPNLPDGKRPVRKGGPYQNTEYCWGYLQESSTFARHLGLVAPDAFVDRRNPPPRSFVEHHETVPEPRCVLTVAAVGHQEALTWELLPWSLPRISTDLSWGIRHPTPEPVVTGYHYAGEDQPFHLELWVEKSTLNDELIPVCRELGMNLVTSIGFQSITAAVNLLKRVGDRPVRVFWLSDFDPAGDAMPAAVSRQVEFYLEKYAPGTDIKITPLALTRAQVIQYDLPRIPIKDSDNRKAGFEDRRGEGAVELDALEALHPGTLAEIVRDAASPYRDETLPARLAEAGEEAQDRVDEAWEEATAGCRERLEEIKHEAEKICQRYESRLAKIDKELQRDLKPLKARLDEVKPGVRWPGRSTRTCRTGPRETWTRPTRTIGCTLRTGTTWSNWTPTSGTGARQGVRNDYSARQPRPARRPPAGRGRRGRRRGRLLAAAANRRPPLPALGAPLPA
jgi:hypothetical protein